MRIKELCDAAGVSRKFIENCIASGHFTPTNETPRGSSREFTESDAVAVITMSDLANAGLQLSLAVKVIEAAQGCTPFIDLPIGAGHHICFNLSHIRRRANAAFYGSAEHLQLVGPDGRIARAA